MVVFVLDAKVSGVLVSIFPLNLVLSKALTVFLCFFVSYPSFSFTPPSCFTILVLLSLSFSSGSLMRGGE